jgi:Ca2+/Na+ antiporter
MSTLNLSAQLQTILAADAALIANTLTTTSASLRNATVAAVITTAPETVAIAQSAAQSATSELVSKMTAEAGPELGPIVSWAANTYLTSGVENLFNYLVGHAAG